MSELKNLGLSDLINRAMDLPLDWGYSCIDTEIPSDILLEFSNIAGEIAGKTLERRAHAAISFLWKTRRYVGITAYNDHDFVGTEITASESRRISQILDWSVSEAANVIAPKASNSPSLSALLLSEGRDQVIDVFLTKERLILREFGLNQSSTEIIIERLKKFKIQALLNVSDHRTINSDRITKSCAALYEISRQPVAIYAGGIAGAKARSSQRRKLRQAKDKIVGIATLFGDAAPLLVGAKLDVVSYLSTAFGATAMALLPRGSS